MWHAYSPKRASRIEEQKQWKDYRTKARMKRTDNVIKSTKILKDAKIKYEVIGKSYIIKTDKGKIVFYPTTGTYQGICNGRGIFNLINDILL